MSESSSDQPRPETQPQDTSGPRIDNNAKKVPSAEALQPATAPEAPATQKEATNRKVEGSERPDHGQAQSGAERTRTLFQNAHQEFHASEVSPRELIGIKNIISAGQSIADLIDVDVRPYVEETSVSELAVRLESRAFENAVSATGLVVIEFPDRELLDPLCAAALAVVSRRGGDEIRPHWVVVGLRVEGNWITFIVNKIASEMQAKSASIGVVQPDVGSAFHRAFWEGSSSLRHLDQSLKDAGKLLLVLLQRADTPGDTAPTRREFKFWLRLSSEKAIAASLDRGENWVKDVGDLLLRRTANARLSYSQLKAACEEALKAKDISQFNITLQEDQDRASATFKRLLNGMHGYETEATFDLVALFLAAYLPGLNISHFSTLAQRIIRTLPPPPPPKDVEKSLGWPTWSPRDLRRLSEAHLIALNPSSDGGRRVFCASLVVASRLKDEFASDYIVLTELRRELLSSSFFAEGFLSAEQMREWAELVGHSQRDDPGTNAIRELARSFAAEGLRKPGRLKDLGARTSVATEALWNAWPEQHESDGITASFIASLSEAVGSDLAFQTLRFCSRDASSRIPPKIIANWIQEILKGSFSIDESLVHAFVREAATIADVERREYFLTKILDWTLDEQGSIEMRQRLRDALANAVWAALTRINDHVDTSSRVTDLPCVGGIPLETTIRLLSCLSEDTTVRIIDTNVRRAFGPTKEVNDDSESGLDWLQFHSGFVTMLLLAEWRERLVGDFKSAGNEGETWLKAVIAGLKKDRDRRQRLRRYATFVVDLFRHLKDYESEASDRKDYVRLLKSLNWIRSELRADSSDNPPRQPAEELVEGDDHGQRRECRI
jgi:hypothetical protein